MKPAPFCYHRPSSIEEAVQLLLRYEGDAKLIAGGQSLMPMLAFRLLAPPALIDLAAIRDLRSARFDDEGLLLGARFRWVDIERSAEIGRRYPLLAAGVAHIAHYQIRNRGTVGGSIAHADPAAEFPALLLAHDGVVHVTGPDGDRTIPGPEFFHGMLTTDLAPEEIVTAIRLPAWPAGRRWAFREFARRSGDFAIAGVALHFGLQDGCIRDARVVAFGIDDRPVVLGPLETMLEGMEATPETAAGIGRECVGLTDIDPPSDAQGSADYRRSLLGVLMERALNEAIARQGEPA